ncbi:hypothetical protein LCGC14_1586550, partial [marine sediment metagenome]
MTLKAPMKKQASVTGILFPIPAIWLIFLVPVATNMAPAQKKSVILESAWQCESSLRSFLWGRGCSAQYNIGKLSDGGIGQTAFQIVPEQRGPCAEQHGEQPDAGDDTGI